MRRRYLQEAYSSDDGSYDFNNYMTIEVLADNTRISMPRDVKYGIDGQGWYLMEANVPMTFNAGQFVSFKCRHQDNSEFGTIFISGLCNLKGNCYSLITGSGMHVASLKTSDDVFRELFKSCTAIVNVDPGFLSATDITWGCYRSMFDGCTSLTVAPELPATTLSTSCYLGMFAGCTSLITAPELPATTLASNCYYGMFDGCTSLVTAPELPATTLKSSCYAYMFKNCDSLVNVPSILPATELAASCYQSMFYGCTSLTTAPELPAPVLSNLCYVSMFMYCKNLNYIKMLATEMHTYQDTSPLSTWTSNVASTGTFVKSPQMNVIPLNSSEGVPKGWTLINDGNFIYTNCTSLTIINAENVTSEKTETVVRYMAICDGINNDTGETFTGVPIYDIGISDPFPQNTSFDDIERVITFTYYGATATTTIVQKGISNYLRFKAIEPSTVSLNHVYSDVKYKPIVEYSYDGNNWIGWDGSTITLNTGDILLLRGEGYSSSPGFSYNSKNYSSFNMSGKIESYGDVMSLTRLDLNYYQSVGSNAFYKLFEDCTALITSPELPATNLSLFCYDSMFSGCTYLTTAPELPATTLKSYCYNNMFNSCTSLTTAPELPALILDGGCYQSMFSGCKALTTAPELPATKLAESCYSMMFQNCTSLINISSILPATELPDFCYSMMFSYCKSLTIVPEIPANIIGNRSCGMMFDGCSNIVTCPSIIPATKVGEGGCQYMFSWCTNLTVAPILPATELGKECYHSMFASCTSLTQAPSILPATTLAKGCYNNMFSDCYKLTAAPELPALTLTNECYRSMFYNCNKLNYVKMLATDISATDCLSNWLFSVSTSGTFVKNANMNDLPKGDDGIPNLWTVQNA